MIVFSFLARMTFSRDEFIFFSFEALCALRCVSVGSFEMGFVCYLVGCEW